MSAALRAEVAQAWSNMRFGGAEGAGAQDPFNAPNEFEEQKRQDARRGGRTAQPEARMPAPRSRH